MGTSPNGPANRRGRGHGPESRRPNELNAGPDRPDRPDRRDRLDRPDPVVPRRVPVSRESDQPSGRADTVGGSPDGRAPRSGGRAGVAAPVLERPLWRGRLHIAAFAVSVPAGIALCLAAGSMSARVSTAVYSMTLTAVFGASAAFHTVMWSPLWHRRMNRVDRALIYLLVAGTYTPISLLALSKGLAIAVLTGIWASGAAGAALVLVRGNLHGVGFTIYILMGWPGIVVLPFAADRLHLTGVLLVLIGGLVYTAGAVILMNRRPDPNPAVFGYHEVWHALTIIAAACHWTAIWLLVRSIPPS
jgi:hemolysin III